MLTVELHNHTRCVPQGRESLDQESPKDRLLRRRGRAAEAAWSSYQGLRWRAARPYGVTGSKFANSRVTDARAAEPHTKGSRSGR